jgi:S1-C subfamily serine protease
MGAFARRARELVGLAGVAARSSATTPWRAGACVGARVTLARAPPTFASRGGPPLRAGWTRGLASSAAGAADAEDRDLLQSIVKVFTVHSSPNYFMPWQNKPQRETSGSGVVVAVPVPGGVGVLTNAHVVADQTFVQVRRHGSSVKHQARVHAVGHECDLAVLTVDDPAFWVDATVAPRAADASDDADASAAGTKEKNVPKRKVQPLPLGDVPHLQEHVTVMGFPQGGDNLSITSGVVSRVELTNYVHGAAQLLAIQLDAAINPGNSGGPAVQNGKVVGLAFQNLANADNIGYVIPTPIVRRFLEDVSSLADGNANSNERRGAATEKEKAEETSGGGDETSGGATFETHHAGFCALGVKCQATDNPALRAYFGMAPHETGVVVTHIAPLSPSRGVLRKDDVLLAIDGRKIANDGTVSFRGWERVAFDHLVSLKRPDEAVALTVRRRDASEDSEDSEDSKRKGSSGDQGSLVKTLTVRVKPRAPLVPAHQYDRLPSFFLYAGLVFSPLTQPHLHEFGDDWFNAAPRRLCDRALNDHPTVEGEQVVLLSQVLADEINAGYQGMHDVEVRSVNGERVRNLRQLKERVENAGGAFLRLDLADDRVLVVNREEADKAHARIMAKHRVPSRVSRDLEA